MNPTSTQQDELRAAGQELVRECERLAPIGSLGSAVRRMRAILTDLDGEAMPIPETLRHPGRIAPTAPPEPGQIKAVVADAEGIEPGPAGFNWVVIQKAPRARVGSEMRRRPATPPDARAVARRSSKRRQEFWSHAVGWVLLVIVSILLGMALAPR